MHAGYDATSGPHRFGLAWAAAAALCVATAVMAVITDVPIHDPDAFIPGYIRMPAIVLLAILVDVVPRVVARAASRRMLDAGGLRVVLLEVVRERWPASHLRFALTGAAAWYLCYAAFRNVKSMAPVVNERNWDDELAAIDHFLFAGHDPANVLHAWFGTGFMAHFMSVVYVVWIALVPATIAIALVWTRHTSAGAWYVTAVAVDWALGALLYVVLPTVGPIYSDPKMFADLPHTWATDLQETLWTDRLAVMADPVGSGTLQTVAAFASLHVGICVTIAIVAHLIRLPGWVRTSAWVFLGLTVLSTVYLGWHFFVDVLGGFVVGAFAVWVAGIATGNRDGWRVRLSARAPSASDVRPAGLDAHSEPQTDHLARD